MSRVLRLVGHRIILGHWADWSLIRAPEPPYPVLWKRCRKCGLETDR